MKLYSFYSDLSGLQFHDSNTIWMQAMPKGNYKHPVYGDIKFTDERVQRFAKNVNDGVVGTALDIDYDHKAFTTKAAGWVKAAEARPDGLWIQVEFTNEAATAIRNGEYRYFSPEFADKWTHPKSGTEFEDVLRGGGLTNRPFLKDILPVNLSELSFGNPKKEEVGVTPKELRSALGLAETATDEEVRVKLTELTTPKTPPAPPTDPSAALLSELQKQLGDNPIVKALGDQLKTQGDQLKAISEQLKLNEVRTQINSANTGKMVMAPAAREAFEKMMLGDSVSEQATAFLKLLAEGNAIVETGERGATDPSKQGETDAEKLWDTEIAKLMSEQKLDYGTAATTLAASNPKLFKEYREASTAFTA